MAAEPENLVPLSPEMSRLVRELVDSGRFPSAADAVHGALLLLRDDDPPDADEAEGLRADVAAGLAQLDAGQGRPWDAEAAKARLRASAAPAERSGE
jgi:antitoxin ParD1/3/4